MHAMQRHSVNYGQATTACQGDVFMPSAAHKEWAQRARGLRHLTSIARNWHGSIIQNGLHLSIHFGFICHSYSWTSLHDADMRPCLRQGYAISHCLGKALQVYWLRSFGPVLCGLKKTMFEGGCRLGGALALSVCTGLLRIGRAFDVVALLGIWHHSIDHGTNGIY